MNQLNYIVRYRKGAIRFVMGGARKVYEIVGELEATKFISETHAWKAIGDFRLDTRFCSVEQT